MKDIIGTFNTDMDIKMNKVVELLSIWCKMKTIFFNTSMFRKRQDTSARLRIKAGIFRQNNHFRKAAFDNCVSNQYKDAFKIPSPQD